MRFPPAVCLFCLALQARQTVVKPYQVSPAASVSQTLGVSTVRIDYHRPAVRGRKIWGGLVPFGQVWRAGANDATVIDFSDPVKIGGKDLAAGSYALFAIPGRDQWTLVFNREAKQWGAFNYKEGQDALRIQAKPRPAPYHEYLTYELEVTGPDALRVDLDWENLAVGFEVALDAQGIYWTYLEKTVAGAGPDEWQPLNQAASYCLLTGTHLDQALLWVDRSIQAKEGYRNLRLKAQLLYRQGRVQEALPVLDKAIALASGAPAQAREELEALRGQWGAAKP